MGKRGRIARTPRSHPLSGSWPDLMASPASRPAQSRVCRIWHQSTGGNETDEKPLSPEWHTGDPVRHRVNRDSTYLSLEATDNEHIGDLGCSA